MRRLGLRLPNNIARAAHTQNTRAARHSCGRAQSSEEAAACCNPNPLSRSKLRALLHLGPRYETLFVSAGPDMHQIAELVAAGKLRPHVQAVMPLAQAR